MKHNWSNKTETIILKKKNVQNENEDYVLKSIHGKK